MDIGCAVQNTHCDGKSPAVNCPPYPHCHLSEEKEVDAAFQCAAQPTLVEQAIPRVRCSARCVRDAVKSKVPIATWLPKYKWKTQLKGDIIAGLTLGVMLIPQGLAYAMLAGLPPYYGLYACLGPALTYCALGTSSQLHIGPFALISLLVAQGASNALPKDVSEQAYIDAVLLMSLIVGVYLVAMGLLRMGFVVSFLAEPVLSGFTTGSAFLIATSQVKDIFGLKIPSNLSFGSTWLYIFKHFKATNPAALIMAIITILALLLMRSLGNKYKAKLKGVPIPGELIVLIVGTAVVEIAHLHTRYGLRTVGTVPAGLPGFHIPSTTYFSELLGPSASLALMLYVMSISTAKTFALKNGYEVDPNQELLALGFSNIIGGFWKAYPASASLSRTALVHAVGASSPLHNLVCVVVMTIMLVSITPLLSSLPMAVLASIIVVALQSLFLQVKEPLRLWGVQKSAAALWILTFFATIFLGTNTGLALGVLASMVMLMQKTSRPSWAVLGRLPGTDIYRNVRRYPAAREFPGILVFRWDDALHFANKDYFKETLMKLIKQHSTMTELYTVIIEAGGISDMDASAVDMLTQASRDIKADLLFSGCKGRLRDRLSASGLFGAPIDIGPCNRALFVNLDEAVRWAEDKNMRMLQDAEAKARNNLRGAVPALGPAAGVAIPVDHDRSLQMTNLNGYHGVGTGHTDTEDDFSRASTKQRLIDQAARLISSNHPKSSSQDEQDFEDDDDDWRGGGRGGHGVVDDWRTDHDFGSDFDLDKKRQELEALEARVLAEEQQEEMDKEKEMVMEMQVMTEEQQVPAQAVVTEVGQGTDENEHENENQDEQQPDNSDQNTDDKNSHPPSTL